MWREPLGVALHSSDRRHERTILDDPLDAQGGTSCRNCSWTSSPHWMATFVPELSDGSGKRKPSRDAVRMDWPSQGDPGQGDSTIPPRYSPFWVRRNVRD